MRTAARRGIYAPRRVPIARAGKRRGGLQPVETQRYPAGKESPYRKGQTYDGSEEVFIRLLNILQPTYQQGKDKGDHLGHDELEEQDPQNDEYADERSVVISFHPPYPIDYSDNFRRGVSSRNPLYRKITLLTFIFNGL